MPDNKMHGH